MGEIDLHIHTSASDGVFSPAEVVEMAGRLGVHALAITDHDTVAGLEEGMRAAGPEVRVIPGVEISAEQDGVQVHLLGYHIDHRAPVLVEGLERFSAARLERACSILDRLDDLGIALPREQLCGAGQDGSIGRPHIARLLMEQGYVSSVEEAFGRYLNYGQKAYVPRPKVSPVGAMEMIHQAGGLAVLAHPWSVTFMLGPLVAEGLDGLEVFYRDYDVCQQRRLARLAAEHRLLCTGGSDYHGPDPHGIQLGCAPVPQDCLLDLDARWRAKHAALGGTAL